VLRLFRSPVVSAWVATRNDEVESTKLYFTSAGRTAVTLGFAPKAVTAEIFDDSPAPLRLVSPRKLLEVVSIELKVCLLFVGASANLRPCEFVADSSVYWGAWRLLPVTSKSF